MRTYKNKKGAFKEIRNKSLRLSIPIVALALLFGWGIGSRNSDDNEQVNTLPYVMLLGIGAVAFGVYRGLNRQKLIFESFVLTIDENSIQREQLNTPTVSINKNEIQEIVKHPNGSFSIKGINRADLIIVTNQIDNYEDLESTLKGFQEFKTQGKQTQVRLTLPLVLGVLILMAIVYTSTNKYLVLVSGTILAGGLLWSIYEIQTNKNIDSKTKRSSWWTILVIITVIAITYKKVMG